MSDTTNEIIKRIEQDDEFRETYYDNIDRLVDKQQNPKIIINIILKKSLEIYLFITKTKFKNLTFLIHHQ